jgi:hypothetical protein
MPIEGHGGFDNRAGALSPEAGTVEEALAGMNDVFGQASMHQATDATAGRVGADMPSPDSAGVVQSSAEGSHLVGDNAADAGSLTYPDEALRPSAQDIADAKATLVAGGLDVSDVRPESGSLPAASSLSSDDLEKLDEDSKGDAEDAQLLSNIRAMKHQTNMGIIGNIR